MNKYMIYEMNVTRSIEYAIPRYMKILEKGGNGKIIVQEMNSNGNLIEGKDKNVTGLAKISVDNYISGLIEDTKQDPYKTTPSFNNVLKDPYL